MNVTRLSVVWMVSIALLVGAGCQQSRPQYGTEQRLFLPWPQGQVWAVAPAVNLSGQRQVDPLLQADLVYQQLQEVHGLTVIPVNRVVEVYMAMGILKVDTEVQAAAVCRALGCDGLLIPTVTLYDPYNPPKIGAAIQVFRRSDVPGGFAQAVGMFDAANGSVREALFRYAAGRSDPVGPYAEREYLVNMDRYGAFVYHELLRRMLETPAAPVAQK